MRTYPSYAAGSVTTGAPASEKWYLNAYDPYNVGGYYPVKKKNATKIWIDSSNYLNIVTE